jgi:hypothetical protein
MFSMPVANCTSRSNPRPKPAWGTEIEKKQQVGHKNKNKRQENQFKVVDYLT